MTRILRCDNKYEVFRTDKDQSFDLSLLYTVLASQRSSEDRQETRSAMKTWELVIIQVSILVPVLLVLLCWRHLRPSCVQQQASSEEKVRDLPPTYSTADLYSLAVSVTDHLQPPPEYLDTLQYLDLDRGSQSRVRLSHVMLPLRSPSRVSLSSPAVSRQQSRTSLSSMSSPVSRASLSSMSSPASKASLSSAFIMQDVGRAFLRQDSSLSGSSLRSVSSSRNNSTKSRSSNASASDLDAELERKLKTVEPDEILTTIVEEK